MAGGDGGEPTAVISAGGAKAPGDRRADHPSRRGRPRTATTPPDPTTNVEGPRRRGRQAAAAEVRLLTIMFTDVEGSTKLATTLGDDAARELLRVHEAVVRGALAEHRGRELRSLGDGLMTAFTSPRRAVACAAAIQREIRRHNRRHPQAPLQLRIGINAGEVLEEPDEVYGEAVNAAARITDRAAGSEVLVSEVVKQLAGTMPGIAFVDRGRCRLKGFAERWRLFRVTWQEIENRPRPGDLAAAPLVGRDSERERLLERCLAATAGRGGLVLVSGDAGIGKTRLVDEAAREAATLDMLPLVGRCHDDEGSPPYAPFLEILEAALDAMPPDQLRAALGAAAPEVARMAPALRQALPDLPPPLEMPTEQERHSLFRGIRGFVARAGERAPLFLVLDDIHWADTATLLLLEHLAEHVQRMAVLVIATYRDADLRAGTPLVTTVERLIRRRTVEHMTLGPLQRDGIAAMLRAVNGRDAPDRLVDLIAANTDGNPFFVEEVQRHLAEQGRLLDATGDWRADAGLGEIDVPRSVRLVIGRRLDRLGAPARRALTIAAGIGRRFDFALLEALAGPGADGLLDALDEAERAHLVTSTLSGGAVGFSFAHELIRQTLLADLSLPHRQALHLQVADATERVHGDRAEHHAAMIAHHLVQAGAAARDRSRTVRYLRLAAAAALRSAAFEEALRQLDTALELLGDSDELRRAELLILRGATQQGLGSWADSMAAWRSALDIHEQRGDGEAVARLAAEMAIQLGWSGRLLESVELAARGLSLVGETESEARALLLAIGGNAFGFSGNHDAGDSLTASASTIADAVGSGRAAGFALNSRAAHHFYWTELGAAIEVGRRASERLRDAGDLFTLASLQGFLELSLLWSGRLSEAEALDGELAALGERLGNHGATMVHLRFRGYRAALAGDFDGLEREATDDLRFERRHGLPWASDALVHLGLADFWRGDWEGAVSRFEDAAREPAIEGAFSGAVEAFGLLALLSLGRAEAAQARSVGLLTRLPQPGQPIMLGQLASVCALVQSLPRLGRADEAAALQPHVTGAIARGMVLNGWDLYPLRCVEGIAASAGARWAEAERAFRLALDEAHELGHALAAAEARRHYGAMLVRRREAGDASLARLLLLEAADRYGRMRMPGHRALAEIVLESL